MRNPRVVPLSGTDAGTIAQRIGDPAAYLTSAVTGYGTVGFNKRIPKNNVLPASISTSARNKVLPWCRPTNLPENHVANGVECDPDRSPWMKNSGPPRSKDKK